MNVGRKGGQPHHTTSPVFQSIVLHKTAVWWDEGGATFQDFYEAPPTNVGVLKGTLSISREI